MLPLIGQFVLILPAATSNVAGHTVSCALEGHWWHILHTDIPLLT